MLHLTAGQSHTLHITYQADHPFDSLEPGTLLLQWKTPAGADSPAIQAAAAAAKKTQVAIVYVRTYEGEQRDRVSLKLPQSADELVQAVRAANPHTIVVLANSGPVTMPWLNSVPAVVETYFGGQEQGSALASVLWGDVNPSGKLTDHLPDQRHRRPARRRPTPGRPPTTSTSPMARASTSATRATTPPASRRCSHSDTASPTPPSATPTCS